MSGSDDLMRVHISRANAADWSPGRRETLRNRDLGTNDATNGRVLALVTSATQGMGPPSGWHYHPCDYQIIYVLKGWVDFEVEDGTRCRLEAGGALLLPGLMRHNVPGTSAELEVLTVTVPGTYDTVPCDPVDFPQA